MRDGRRYRHRRRVGGGGQVEGVRRERRKNGGHRFAGRSSPNGLDRSWLARMQGLGRIWPSQPSSSSQPACPPERGSVGVKSLGEHIRRWYSPCIRWSALFVCSCSRRLPCAIGTFKTLIAMRLKPQDGGRIVCCDPGLRDEMSTLGHVTDQRSTTRATAAWMWRSWGADHL